MTKEIMDVKEVAEYLALSPTTIYRMLTSGEIPNVKVGGQYRFPKGVIDNWIAGKLELPAGSRETGAGSRKSKATKQAETKRQTKPKPVRVEDEIVGHLLAARAAGSREETDRAKQLMLEKIEQIDMAYLAAKAKEAGVLAEAVAAQNELITEASR